MQAEFETLDLPQMVAEASYAKDLKVMPNGLGRMYSEHTIPAPFARDREKALWLAGDLKEWYGHIQESQSAYASIDRELGVAELNRLGAYVCPATSSLHIGQRRPAYLALYVSGLPKNARGLSEVTIYPVTHIQTQEGVMGESVVWRKGQPGPKIVPWDQVRPNDSEKLTLFKLDVARAHTIEITRAWQRGGTVRTDSLLSAMKAGYAHHFQGGIAHAK
ncbi:hypothetical protein ACTXJX_11825 [Glutamicibacter ardleyensis]|uniref:hypothetical protein n=1 Tax=Glutamicibacter ardleyensis TaxID=225894 RepID=UPI003FD58FA4